MAENECNPIPMAEWIQQEDPPQIEATGLCKARSCLLAPVVRWYRDLAQETGQTEIARKIEGLAETADVLTICQELDKIKEAVDTSTRERLKLVDCAAQSYAGQNFSEQTITTKKEADSG